MSPCCLLIITLFSSRCLQIEWAQRFSLLKCTMKALDNRLCLKAFELLGFLVFKMELIRLGKKCAHTLKHDDLSIKVGYVKVTELMMKKPLWIPYIKKVPGSSALNHSNKQKVVAAWKLEHMALKMQIQMYMAIGKNTHTYISAIWKHTDHFDYGLLSLCSFAAAYNPLVHNWDLTFMQGKQGNKAAFFQCFYLISATAMSGQNTCQDCWPLCLFIYKARLMIAGREKSLINEWDILWRQNAKKVSSDLISKNRTINMEYFKYSLWTITEVKARGTVRLQNRLRSFIA